VKWLKLANVTSENNENQPAEDVARQQSAESPHISFIPTNPPFDMTEAAAPAAPISWTCHKCHTIVPEPRVRCSACCSWKDGQRKPYSKSRSKAAQKRKERAAAETLSILAEGAAQDREAVGYATNIFAGLILLIRVSNRQGKSSC
jgi:hypothetical protein